LTTSYSFRVKRTGNSNTTSLTRSYEEAVELDTDDTYSKTYEAFIPTEQNLMSELTVRLSVRYNYYDISYEDT